jgi:sulfatase modifying factor 1
MRLRSDWPRLLLCGALTALCGVACDTVLDIQAPKMRPNANGGEGGEVTEPNGAGTNGAGTSGAGTSGAGTSGAGTSGSATMPSGGEGGAEPVTLMGGAGGEAGTPPLRDCEAGALRCGSDAAAKAPEICDETGHWVANTDEADGDCPTLCDAGKCVECVASAGPRCAVCQDDDPSCSPNQPQTCVDGAWVDQGDKPCLQFCDAGVCKTAPSCNAANKDRTTCQGNRSCCESLLVPGGKFKRDFDGSSDYHDASHPAEISAFYLDKFEVTVGRMRQFVSAFDAFNPPKSGAGKSRHIPEDPGWDTEYKLPADAVALIEQLKCPGTTWSDTLNDNNDLPVNCASFYVAYAFCIWDGGGRLPTNTEWNYAAAGGDEQRRYPWKSPSSGPLITEDYASYDNAYPGPISVGSKPLGDARWRHSDLSGNVAEWTLDYSGDYPSSCKDCLNVTPAASRIQRGGAFNMPQEQLLASFVGDVGPSQRFSVLGFRCVRDPDKDKL